MSQDGFLAMLARRQHLLQSWDIHHLNKEYEETGFSIYIYWQTAQCARRPFYCNFQISNKFGSVFTLPHNPLSTAPVFFAQPFQRKPEIVGLECQLLNLSGSQGEHPCRVQNVHIVSSRGAPCRYCIVLMKLALRAFLFSLLTATCNKVALCRTAHGCCVETFKLHDLGVG